MRRSFTVFALILGAVYGVLTAFGFELGGGGTRTVVVSVLGIALVPALFSIIRKAVASLARVDRNLRGSLVFGLILGFVYGVLTALAVERGYRGPSNGDPQTAGGPYSCSSIPSGGFLAYVRLPPDRRVLRGIRNYVDHVQTVGSLLRVAVDGDYYYFDRDLSCRRSSGDPYTIDRANALKAGSTDVKSDEELAASVLIWRADGWDTARALENSSD